MLCFIVILPGSRFLKNLFLSLYWIVEGLSMVECYPCIQFTPGLDQKLCFREKIALIGMGGE